MLDLVIAAIRDLARRGALPGDLVGRELSAGTTIDELSIDSMAKLDLISELEVRADTALSEGMIQGLRTLGDLADALAAAKEAA